MKTLALSAGLLGALVLGGFLAGATTPQDAMGGDDAVAGMPPMPTAQEQHELLARQVGKWDATVKFYDPMMGEMAMQGTETVEMFGPFWQMSHFEGDFMGMPFQGRSTTGYDPVRKQWVGTWVDTMSPWMVYMEGDYDEQSRTLTFEYEGVNGMTGQLEDMKSVLVFTGPDSHTYEGYSVAEDGTETLQMRIDYTRKGKAKGDKATR